MIQTPLLSVIIPAHNEETRLPSTLEKLQKFLGRQAYQSEIWVVENGSTDRTADLVKESALHNPSIRLAQTSLRGKGLAVRTGMFHATGSFRFLCDADLSMPVEEIERFLPPHIGDADLAIGSREIRGARRFNEPFYRHLTGRFFSLAVKLIVLQDFEDTQCGFKCFRAAAAEDLFSRQRFDGWSFDVEILYLARKRKYRIREVPISWYYQADSRIRLVNDSLRMFLDLLQIRWNDAKGLYEKSVSRTQPRP